MSAGKGVRSRKKKRGVDGSKQKGNSGREEEERQEQVRTGWVVQR